VARQVLVTGAAGFVGAGIVRRLLADGENVVAAVGPRSDTWRIDDLAAELHVVPLELADREAVSAAVADAQPEWVFHLAAHGGYSWQADRRRIFDANLTGTINVLEAAMACAPQAVLCAGSSSEYGRKDHAPAESELPEPNSDYAVAKAAATLFASYLGREHGMPVATLRLYSVYGPYEEPARLIPSLVVNGLNGRLPPLVSAATARDFVYLEDAVDAFLLAASRGVTPGAVFNVGSGVETTIAEAAELTREVFAISSEARFGEMTPRGWDTDRWVADPSRIAAELGWRARVSLREGLELTAHWLEHHPELWERYGFQPPEAPA